MPEVKLDGVTKRYGKVTAVDHLDLIVRDGEILTLLGPSGCGKTTTLRCIAGFIVPDEGRIFLGEEEVTRLPPEKRDIGFVFQNYALWPHMTVFQNLAFGLQLRHTPREEIRQRVREVLSLVRFFRNGGSLSPPAFRRATTAGGVGPGVSASTPGTSPG